MSTTRSPYPKNVPRSVTASSGAPPARTFSTAPIIPSGDIHWPFLMFTARPARPAAAYTPGVVSSAHATTRAPAMGTGPPQKFGANLAAEPRPLGGAPRPRLAGRRRPPVGARGAHEPREQRMRPRRPRLELGVE